MARRKIRGARAIVTGASSGIGQALARELARRGAELLVTARRESLLRDLVEQLAPLGGDPQFLAGDITDAQHRERLRQAAEARWGGLDLLVNNAGSGAYGPFADADPQRLRQVMEVNLFAPAELTRICLPLLERGTRPMLVNVGSVLGHRAAPGKSEYCASKFALHGLSDALRAELAPRGIEVLLVSPSTTDTEFFDKVGAGDPSAKKRRKASPEAVARHAVRAIQRGGHEIILSPGGKLLVWLDRLTPTVADWLMARFGRSE
ncbi:MAG: SDR family NAD(P)-dependent oxidoreductase [Pirellulaceae bacterium]